MSIVIVDGEECMIRQYQELCGAYRCKAKAYRKMNNGLKKIGLPDLPALFTNTVSHKMTCYAARGVKGRSAKIARAHTSSIAAPRAIPEANMR